MSEYAEIPSAPSITAGLVDVHGIRNNLTDQYDLAKFYAKDYACKLSQRAIHAAPRIAGYGMVASVMAAPLVGLLELKTVNFDDYLGTAPINAQLGHNNKHESVLHAGLLDDIYYNASGAFGLSLQATPIGSPESGGNTLSSYTNPAFAKRNVAFIHDLDKVAAAYKNKFIAESVKGFASYELAVLVVGGSLIYRDRRQKFKNDPDDRSKRAWIAAGTGVTLLSTALSAGGATYEWNQWTDSQNIGEQHCLQNYPKLCFKSTKTHEIAPANRAGHPQEQRADQSRRPYL